MVDAHSKRGDPWASSDKLKTLRPCGCFFFVMAHRLEYAPQSPRNTQASSVVVIVDVPGGDRLVFKTIIQPRRQAELPTLGLLMLLPRARLCGPCSCWRPVWAHRVLMDPVLRAVVVVASKGGSCGRVSCCCCDSRFRFHILSRPDVIVVGAGPVSPGRLVVVVGAGDSRMLFFLP